MSRHTSWPDERREVARKLYVDDGLSAAEVGKKLGATRLAVTGLVHREKWVRAGGAVGEALHKRISGARSARKGRTMNPAQPEPRRLYVAGGHVREAQPDVPLPELREPVIAHAPKPLLDARGAAGEPGSDCRWPVSGQGADLMVCGAPATRKTYCAAHGAVAYRSAGG